ncbi:MAG: hypothetical protein ACKVOH_05030, partial [Chlamydiales bacterium]
RFFILFVLSLYVVGFSAERSKVFRGYSGSTYVEMGGGTMPFHPSRSSTYVSVGKKFERGRNGLDFSIAHQMTSIFDNYLSVRGLYTRRIAKNFYIGFGPGLGNYMDPIPKTGGTWGNIQASTLEGVAGYHFAPQSRIKPALQLHLTQPAHVFHNSIGHKVRHTPSFALSFNLRF